MSNKKVYGGYITEKTGQDILAALGGGDTPIKFDLDGVVVPVLEDTVTPANNQPLPVKLSGFTGDITVNANELNVGLSHVAGSADAFDSTRIGSGVAGEFMTVEAETSAGGDFEARVRDIDAKALLTTIDVDTGSIDTKIPAQGAALIAASLPVNIASDQVVPVSATALPLPTGAATSALQTSSEAILTTIDADTGSIDTKIPSQGAAVIAASLPVNIASDQVVPVSATALPLPTGAATSALQTSSEAILTTIDTDTGAIATSVANIDGKLPVTIGQKAKAASLAVVLASDSDALPVVAATLDVNHTVYNVNSSTAITASAGVPITLVTLTADVKKVQCLDTSGEFIGIYSDPAGTPLLEFIIGPGSDQTIEVDLPNATVIGARNMENAAIAVGTLALNFMG